MNERDIESALLQELSVILSLEPAKLSPETPLRDLGVDSMSFVELLVFIEKHFRLKLIESGLSKEDFHTIRALAGRIAREMKGQSWG